MRKRGLADEGHTVAENGGAELSKGSFPHQQAHCLRQATAPVGSPLQGL